ncbi:MAG: hypothetical protein GY947_24295 [Rhodobacteraceae bacterium]|nr:hypothetical protein [Paracoccaceae bacterium]
MKITIDIDCTPEEARTFLGLPDVKTMQDAMMVHVQAKLKEQMSGMDPEVLMKTWFTPGMENLGQMQKAFWDAAMNAGGGSKREDD